MPQLRDSGTRTLHANEPVPSSEMDGFARIFGVETEYGVSVTGVDKPVDAGQTAMTMFQPVVSRSRSTNTYLPNGARLYLDVGSHPEYATAEALDPLDALVQDLAGERIMRRLALQAQERLRATYGPNATIHVYKNNVDSAGHAFGCHENYLVRRFVPLEAIEAQLLPFLITRQIFTGAGRYTSEGFQITQRAEFLDEAVSSATTRSRPMVNTRDEPHADPDAFRRLHVIIGDSNRSGWATRMKLATTHLVLCVIEAAFRSGEQSGFEAMALVDPAAANKAVSKDLTCRTAQLKPADEARYATEVGSEATALAMQYHYCDVVERFMQSRSEIIGDCGFKRTEALKVLSSWRDVLDSIANTAPGELPPLHDRVDWVAKRRIIEGLRARHPGMTLAQVERIELDYHDVANGKVFDALLQRNGIDMSLPDLWISVDRAMQEPPDDTRAALRGRFVTRALAAGAQFSCDWTHLTLTSPQRREVILLDPFDATPDDDYRRLMAVLG